jgi:O-antigen/teichoic acid export membrane protein
MSDRAERGGRLVGQAAGAAAVQVWLGAIGLFTTPFLLRHLGPAAYGVFAMVAAVSGQLSNLELGFGQATVVYLARARAALRREEERAILETSAFVFVGAGLLAAALLGAGAGWLTRSFFNVPAELQGDALSAFRWGALILGLSFASSFLAAVLQALARVGWLNATRGLIGTAASLGSVAVVALGGALRGLFRLQAAITVLGLLLLVLGAARARALAWPRPDRRTAVEMARFSAVVFLAGIAYQWMINGPPLVLGALVGAAEIPAFSVPHLVLQKLAMLIAAASLAFLPFASAAAAVPGGGGLGGAFRAHLRLTLLTMGPVSAYLAVFAHPLLAAWVSEGFAQAAAPCLRLLAAAGLVLAVSGPPADVARAQGRPLWVLVYTAVVAAVGLLGSLLLVPRWRAPGAAAAFFLALLVGTPPLLIAVARTLLAIHPAALARTVAGPLAAVAALAAVYALGARACPGLLPALATGALATTAFAFAAYRLVLEPGERAALRRLLRRAA